jgi:hypothetical protein
VAPTFSLLTAALLVAQSPGTPSAAPSTCPCMKNNNNISQVQYVAPVPADIAPGSGYVTSAPAPTPTTDNHPIMTRIRNFFRGTDPSVDANANATVVTSEPPTADQKRLWRPLPTTTTTTTSSPTMVTPVAAPVASPSIQAIPTSSVAPTALPPAPVKIVTPVSSPSIPTTAPTASPSIPVNSSMIATPSSSVSQVSMNVPATTVTPLPSRPSKISPDLVSKVGHADDYAWITGQIRIENGVHVLHYATPETVDRYNGHVVLTSDKDLRNTPEGAYVCVRGNIASTSGSVTTYRVQALDILTANR